MFHHINQFSLPNCMVSKNNCTTLVKKKKIYKTINFIKEIHPSDSKLLPVKVVISLSVYICLKSCCFYKHNILCWIEPIIRKSMTLQVFITKQMKKNTYKMLLNMESV